MKPLYSCSTNMHLLITLKDMPHHCPKAIISLPFSMPLRVLNNNHRWVLFTIRIGIIGYCTRMSSLVDRILEFELGAQITAIASLDFPKVKELLADRGIDSSYVELYSDTEEILDKEQLDGVLICTRCSWWG